MPRKKKRFALGKRYRSKPPAVKTLARGLGKPCRRPAKVGLGKLFRCETLTIVTVSRIQRIDVRSLPLDSSLRVTLLEFSLQAIQTWSRRLRAKAWTPLPRRSKRAIRGRTRRRRRKLVVANWLLRSVARWQSPRSNRRPPVPASWRIRFR